MAHHKRKRPKTARAGCGMCKPWKQNGAKDSIHALSPRDFRERERAQIMLDEDSGSDQEAIDLRHHPQ